MEKLIIRRPEEHEKESINVFFRKVLLDTFFRNDLITMQDLLHEEIEDKIKCLEQDFETDGSHRFFLLAELEGEIIGSVEYGNANKLIKECTNNELAHLPEIGTVFVDPIYQGKGVSDHLLLNVLNQMQVDRVKEACFDSGYKLAQETWNKKFGEPQYFLENYWGEGDHHMVWKFDIESELNKIEKRVISRRQDEKNYIIK